MKEETMNEAVITAHKYCKNNKARLPNDFACGCFYCLNVYPPSEITDWLKEGEGTALCPYCGVDAVLGESAGYPMTREFLKEMHRYWFAPKNDG